MFKIWDPQNEKKEEKYKILQKGQKDENAKEEEEEKVKLKKVAQLEKKTQVWKFEMKMKRKYWKDAEQTQHLSEKKQKYFYMIMKKWIKVGFMLIRKLFLF